MHRDMWKINHDAHFRESFLSYTLIDTHLPYTTVAEPSLVSEVQYPEA